MKEPVERYEPSYYGDMTWHAHGAYVEYSDYDALFAKVKAIAAEVTKERKSAADWHARMEAEYRDPHGSAFGSDVCEASAVLQAWEKAEELLKDFSVKEGKQS